MNHNFEEPQKSKGCTAKINDQNPIMSRADGINGRPWSKCSRESFQALYAKNKNSWCLESKY